MKKIKILGYICARLGSSRLPGKMLMDIAGKPAIQCVYDRLSQSKYLDKVVVATSNKPIDDPLCDYMQKNSIEFIRGDEDDVLGRIVDVVDAFHPEICVEVYGDAPFNDSLIVDQFICHFLNSNFDFLSNDMDTTYPPGLDVEVFKADAIKLANNLEKDPLIREHGTLAIRMRPKTFNLFNVVAPAHLFRPHFQLSLDTKEDLSLFQHLALELTHMVGANKLVQYIDLHPELLENNSLIHRKFSLYRDAALKNLQDQE
jgi:spore coat polysaccharide biosynthesis protein SpsF